MQTLFHRVLRHLSRVWRSIFASPREMDALYRLLYEVFNDLDDTPDTAALQSQDAFDYQWKELANGEAMLINPWFKDNMTLKIAGQPIDQEYFTELKRTVVQENLDDKVEFLGGVSSETLVGLYRRCGVFVFPSTVETFGNPLVEAMACGAPIASSNTAAMPEVVNEAAVFFDPQDVESMAKAISELLNDPGLRSDLGRKAAKRAKIFSWGETAKRTLAVIKQAAFS